MQGIKLHEAIKRMRSLSQVGATFSFSFCSYNSKTKTSDGFKTVDKAVLRKGLKEAVGVKSEVLIAYTDLNTDKPRMFNMALLMTFNGHKIIP